MSTPQTPQPADSAGHDPMLPTWRDTPTYATAEPAAPERTDAVDAEPKPAETVDTQQISDDQTTEAPVEQPVADEAAPPEGPAAQEDADSYGGATAAVPDDGPAPVVPPAPPTQQWVRGPSPFTVAVGVMFLVGAVLAIIAMTQDWDPDWALVGPGTVAAIGLLLAAAGVAAAVRRTSD
ncbi:hypothetical protein [Luteipulveratus halotolerans]|uniref:Uncharacterized protein n=1 Tax=Luteipulveratus halotolerans TaxID=1631356 RepID=A0A0L6CJW1_9MICO|nr:hypothetical protein [Luteipulveratus halotolerans]KNX37905.1 hypothetical protein VV01_13260 [Luteipulveratus halotolerans]